VCSSPRHCSFDEQNERKPSPDSFVEGWSNAFSTQEIHHPQSTTTFCCNRLHKKSHSTSVPIDTCSCTFNRICICDCTCQCQRTDNEAPPREADFFSSLFFFFLAPKVLKSAPNTTIKPSITTYLCGVWGDCFAGFLAIMNRLVALLDCWWSRMAYDAIQLCSYAEIIGSMNTSHITISRLVEVAGI
jgi:hypothetical protein